MDGGDLDLIRKKKTVVYANKAERASSYAE